MQPCSLMPRAVLPGALCTSFLFLRGRSRASSSHSHVLHGFLALSFQQRVQARWLCCLAAVFVFPSASCLC